MSTDKRVILKCTRQKPAEEALVHEMVIMARDKKGAGTAIVKCLNCSRELELK